MRMIEGGCFCGSVRYRIEDGKHLAVTCHCSMCRRTSGAPYVSGLVVPVSGFTYTSNTPQAFESSDHGTRTFCPRCGTPIACILDTHPDNVDVTIGSLDEPERFAPTIELHTDTRLAWVPADSPEES